MVFLVLANATIIIIKSLNQQLEQYHGFLLCRQSSGTVTQNVT